MVDSYRYHFENMWLNDLNDLRSAKTASKLQELKNSAAFKSLSDKFSQAVQQLGQGNKTEELKELA